MYNSNYTRWFCTGIFQYKELSSEIEFYANRWKSTDVSEEQVASSSGSNNTPCMKPVWNQAASCLQRWSLTTRRYIPADDNLHLTVLSHYTAVYPSRRQPAFNGGLSLHGGISQQTTTCLQRWSLTTRRYIPADDNLPSTVVSHYTAVYPSRWQPAFTLVSCSPCFSTLEVEATCSSATSADIQRTTRRNISEDRTS
jgi:hypothetical protein